MPDEHGQDPRIQRLRERVEEITGCEVSARLVPGLTLNGPRRISVADFGATADGRTDDSAAVQRAVDHLLEDGGGIVIFPPGKYLIDEVACGPGLTVWGYGATIVKPGIRFYCEKHLRAAGVTLAGDALERRLDLIEVLAFKIDHAVMRRAIPTLEYVLESAEIGREADLDDPDAQAPAGLLGSEELETLRSEVRQIADDPDLTDRELLELMKQLRGSRSEAKWARTFFTGENAQAAPTYRYVGDEDSAPLVFMGLRFDGNRLRMGRYDRHELEQQHMIFLAADAHSRGRLRAWVRDVCLEDGVADGISVYRNVDVTIRNVVARDVFRGSVTCTGGNSRIDLADLRAGGEDHPTGIDWEIDGGSFVRDGEPTDEPNYRNETVASNLVLDGDFDVALRGGSFEGEGIRLLGPPFFLYARLDSRVVIRDSSLAVGSVQASERDDDVRRGRYVSTIYYPQEVLFENVELIGVLPAPDELNGSLAFYSMLVLTMMTQYFDPRDYHLRFRRCRFRLAGAVPEGAETRALSTNNDLLAHGNVTSFEECTFEPGFDYALHVGGGQGRYALWGARGGGSFRFVDTEVGARVAAFLGASDRFRTHADLRGVVQGEGLETLVEQPAGLQEGWLEILP